MRCMGECNGYYSLHAVPTLHVREFEEYIEQLVPLGLASTSRVYWLEEQYTFIPNFEYYDLASRMWRFPGLHGPINLQTYRTIPPWRVELFQFREPFPSIVGICM